MLHIRLLVILLLLFGALSSPAYAGDSIDKVLPLLDRYRDGNEERALRVLSQDNGIALYEGTREEITPEKLQELLQQPIQAGVKGAKIILVQDALVKTGLNLAKAQKGVFGPETVNALKVFQERNGLPNNGQLDAKTWGKLMGSSMPFSASTEAEYVFLGKSHGIKIIHYISPALILEECKRDDGTTAESPTKWNYRLAAIIPKAEWPNFVAKAASHGLMDVSIIKDEGIDFIYMQFRRTGVNSIPVGSSVALKFSPDFYRHMKISLKHGFRRSSSGKMVIIVHEPHSALGGHYQMLDGLKQFFDDNPGWKTRFLVEGDLPTEATRNPTEFLNKITSESAKAREYFNTDLVKHLSEDPGIRRRQILAALDNYVIDGPSAYQLLYNYNIDIPSLAIDDPAALKLSPRAIQAADPKESGKRLLGLKEKLEEAGVGKEEKASQILHYIDYLVMLEQFQADVQGQEIVDLMEEKTKLYGGLAKILVPLRNQAGFANYITFLDKQHKAYESQWETYAQALIRDKTMAGFINHYFHSASKDRLPIAFIGSFHTPGVITELDRDVGYVVIEPQRAMMATRDENERFNDALTDFKKHVQSLTLTNRKLLCKTDAEDFAQCIKSLTPRLPRLETPPELPQFLGNESASLIMHSIRSNSFTRGARVVLAEAGGAGGIPPNVPRLPGLIGSFHPGGGGGGNRGNNGLGDGISSRGTNVPMLVLYPKKKGAWQDHSEREQWSQERLRFLETLVLIPPMESVAKKTKKLSFEQEGNKIYLIYYEPNSGDYYLFEGDREISAASILNLEKMDNVYFHMTISINEIRKDDKYTS